MLHRSPPSRHGSCVNTAKGVADMKETLETIRREALSALEQTKAAQDLEAMRVK